MPPRIARHCPLTRLWIDAGTLTPSSAELMRARLRSPGHLQGAPSHHRRLQVEVGLHVHPELRRRLEELREAQRRVGGYPALATDQLVQADGGDPQRLGRR